MQAILHWDLEGVLALNQFVGINETFDSIMLDIARNHLLRGGLIMGLLWWCWTSSDGKIRFFAVRALLGALIAIGLGRGMQNLMPERPRPLQHPGLDVVVANGLDSSTLAGWSSFPSDTTILFFALSTAIFSANRMLGLFAYAWSLFMVCLPRIYFGYHYPSDILAGIVIGIAIMLFALRVPVRERLPRLFETTQRAWPKAVSAGIFLLAFETASLFEGARHMLRDLAKLAIG